MQIDWKNIDDKEVKEINSWLTIQDKNNLCMSEKSWKQTACDIDDCLQYMDNAEFKNIIGYINGKPAVAVMFGIEQIRVLNLYCIAVKPKYRHMGIAKEVILQLLNNDKSLNLSKPYEKVVASTIPNNKEAQKLFTSLNFDDLGFDGEYVVFEKERTKKTKELDKTF